MNEYNYKLEVSIFPNPASGLVNIEINDVETDVLLSIYSILGDIIYIDNLQEGNNTIIKQLDLTEFPSGVYFLRIYNEKLNIFRKLILQ